MTKLASFFAYILLSVTIISAQASPCPVNYSRALDQTQEVCEETERNQACYGNNTVNITPFSQSTDFDFDAPGDTADVDMIRSLSLSALDEETGDWGISLIRILANLNPNQADDVTMLLFGDVEIESAGEPSETQSVNASTYANLRRYPNTTAAVVSSVTANEPLIATGRLADNSWIQVKTTDSSITGWIFADLLNNFDRDRLSIVTASQRYFAPMQAFYFTSGSQLDCDSVPLDGILIQTPMGVGRVTVWINEVTIDFLPNAGATALVQATSDETMSIELLEGDASITSESGGYVAVAGSVVTVDLSQGNQSPKINPPKPADQHDNVPSPADLFSRSIEPNVPATIETISSANNLSPLQYDEVVEYGVVLTQIDDTQSNDGSDETTESTNGDSQEETSESDDNPEVNAPNCPGNSCNAPGKNKECPGNSCNNNGNGNGNGNNGNGNGNGNNGNGNGNNGNGNGNGNNGNGNGNNGNGNGNGKKK